MAHTYQTYLYGAVLDKEENGNILEGWHVDESKILFESNVYTNPTDAIIELNFTDPQHNNWFATMVARENGEITDEEIFDSSVITIEY